MLLVKQVLHAVADLRLPQVLLVAHGVQLVLDLHVLLVFGAGGLEFVTRVRVPALKRMFSPLIHILLY